MANNFTPVPYQSIQPYAMEGQLASHIDNPATPSAMALYGGMRARRAVDQADYRDYMTNLHGLQAQALQASTQDDQAKNAISLFKDVLTGPGGSQYAASQPALNRLAGGADLNTAGQFAQQGALAKHLSDYAPYIKAMTDAGVVIAAEQVTGMPGSGMTAVATGIPNEVASSAARAPGPTTQTVSKSVAGSPITDTTTVTTGKANPPVPVRMPGQQAAPAQGETPLPSADTQQQPATPQGLEKVDAPKAQALHQAFMQKLQAKRPEEFKKFGSMPWTITPDGKGIYFLDNSGRPVHGYELK